MPSLNGELNVSRLRLSLPVSFSDFLGVIAQCLEAGLERARYGGGVVEARHRPPQDASRFRVGSGWGWHESLRLNATQSPTSIISLRRMDGFVLQQLYTTDYA